SDHTHLHSFPTRRSSDLSAKYLALLEKAGAEPRKTHDLSKLKAILSTGSPLADTSFDYVFKKIKSDVHLASISGGSDIISCFVRSEEHTSELQSPYDLVC